MLVGHIGAALVAKRLEPRLDLGVLLLAALFADLLLWVLVIFGVESVGVAVASGSARFFTFNFPYSHGLAASIVWSGLAAVVGWSFMARGATRRTRLACVLSLTVLSHFVLDVLVHVPDLPIVGAGSLKLGLGLWHYMPSALGVELAIAAAGFVLYLRSTAISRPRTLLVGAVVAVTAVLTLAGPYLPGDPPAPVALALSSTCILVVVVLTGFVAESRVGIAMPKRVGV